MKKPPQRVTSSDLRQSENRLPKRQFQPQFQMSVVLLYDICIDNRDTLAKRQLFLVSL
jgi:hypothetical protein